jgi:hypothetical protein
MKLRNEIYTYLIKDEAMLLKALKDGNKRKVVRCCNTRFLAQQEMKTVIQQISPETYLTRCDTKTSPQFED